MSKDHKNSPLAKHALSFILILYTVYWTVVFFLIAREPSRALLIREYVTFMTAPLVSVVLGLAVHAYFKPQGKAGGLLGAVIFVIAFYGLSRFSKYYSKTGVLGGCLLGVSALIAVLFGSDIEALLNGLLKNN